MIANKVFITRFGASEKYKNTVKYIHELNNSATKTSFLFCDDNIKQSNLRLKVFLLPFWIFLLSLILASHQIQLVQMAIWTFGACHSPDLFHYISCQFILQKKKERKKWHVFYDNHY